MENSEIAIKVENLVKEYRMGQFGRGTLTADLQSWWARKRGKEDPNARIGEKERLVGSSFLALRGVSFEVKKGERIGIIGSNGAGKSTLLKILCRITAPTSGIVGYNGRIASMLEVGTGFNAEMTGRENIYMNGAILGMSSAEIDSKLEQIIEFSECGDFIDTPVKRYSSGMYVKLAFSVAAHLDSEIMIMDEVLAVGDAAFQKKCLDKMRQLAVENGRTVLYVSHNMNTIARLCNRCIVLDKGRKIYDGNVRGAIELYLASGALSATEYDLSKILRVHKPETVFMEHFEFVGKDTSVFKTGEKIKMKLKWSTTGAAREVWLRMSVRLPENLIYPMGMTKCLIADNISRGELHETVVELDSSRIAQGKYVVLLELFCILDSGAFKTSDYIDIGPEFEIESALDNGAESSNYIILDTPIVLS